MKKDTRLIVDGRHPERFDGLVNPPVSHASTITFPTVAAYKAAKPLDGLYYGRYGTHTAEALEEAVAGLEGGERAVILPTGLGAITNAILPFVQTGDHVLVVDTVYAPTRRFCHVFLKSMGIETTYFDPAIGAGIAELIQPETKVVFLESPGSLTFEVLDVPAIVAAVRAAAPAPDGPKVVIDNTWSGGLYFQPFEFGIDLSVQAATKYIGGHSDLMLGTITLSEALYPKVKLTAASLGFAVAPDDCFLALRGLRSLSARLARHQENGLALARWLADRPEVERVLHPALPSCPGHALWKRDFTGSSGLFSVVLKPVSDAAVTAMLDDLELFGMGFSWGGFESLILPIDPSTSRSATRWAADGPCLRLHAGLEDIDDLIADLEQGFARMAAAA